MPSGQMRLRDVPHHLNQLSGIILDAAIEVHSALGNRLSEKTYRNCLAHELRLRGHEAIVEYPLALRYKDLIVPDAYFVDIFVDQWIPVELKCVDSLGGEHEAQLLTYLVMSDRQIGLLFNFHAPMIRDGFRRMANTASRVSA